MLQKKIITKNKELIIRNLSSASDFLQALEVQRESWGLKDIDVIPVHFMIALQEWSYQIGIFKNDKLVSLALVYPLGNKEGFLLHMLCTVPKYRNIGLGKTLLRCIINHLKKVKNPILRWTFDPFDFINSHLYLNVFKAVGYKAEMNYYGELDSKTHGNLPSHRLFCKLNCSDLKQRKFKLKREINLKFNHQKLKKMSNNKATSILNLTFLKIQQNLDRGFLVSGFIWNKKSNIATLIFNK